MACKHAETDELSAYVDGELPAEALAWWDGHVGECVACGREVARMQALRLSVRTHLPPREPSSALRESVRRLIRTHAGELRRPGAAPPARTWAAGLAASILLVGLGFGLGRLSTGAGGADSIPEQVVAGHVRSLQADHLVDIASSEHHVVKPWFAGKLDFSPPVPDLAAAGFPLVGARLDYVAQRTVAGLVYSHGPHWINLLVWPASGPDVCRSGKVRVQQGFNLVDGRAAGMQFWAVSDLNQDELVRFVEGWRRSAAPGNPRCT